MYYLKFGMGVVRRAVGLIKILSLVRAWLSEIELTTTIRE